jgi:hypothetical protein
MTAVARAAVRAIVAPATLALVVAACAPPPVNLPSPGSGGDPASATKQLIIGALGSAGLQVVDATKPYRPPEAPSLVGAPRSIVQVELPDDPDHGFIVIYSLGSAVTAEKAAVDQAAYVASGTGGIQFPPGSHFVIRTVDTTVIFFTWSPGASPDQRTHLIEDALNTIGIGVPVGGA